MSINCGQETKRTAGNLVDLFARCLQIPWFESTAELIECFKVAHKKTKDREEHNCTYLVEVP